MEENHVRTVHADVFRAMKKGDEHMQEIFRNEPKTTEDDMGQSVQTVGTLQARAVYVWCVCMCVYVCVSKTTKDDMGQSVQTVGTLQARAVYVWFVCMCVYVCV